MKSTQLSFVEQGSHGAIRWGSQEILRLEKNSHFFGGHFAIWDQVMIPGGKPEVAAVPHFSSYGSYGQVTDVRYTVARKGGELALTIVPTNTQHGREVLSHVS